MQAYLRPSGMNGTRFNRRLAKAHKAAWYALKAQRADDLQILERVRDFVCSGRGLASEPPELRSKVFLDWSDVSRECVVYDRSTRRKMGHVTRLGVWPC